jgi:hypothetical protein
MKSRRRIALPKAGTTPSRTQLQQGFATGETGFGGQFAQQQSCAPHVRFGSKADMTACLDDVRFAPKSGHWNSVGKCPLCAKKDILPAVLSVELIVQPDVHDVVGEIGVCVNSSLTPLIRLS